jgi:hypothetical protein
LLGIELEGKTLVHEFQADVLRQSLELPGTVRLEPGRDVALEVGREARIVVSEPCT